MNGPEHYLKAEQMLEAAQDAFVLDDDVEGHNMRAAAAQAHATLALAAAVAAGAQHANGSAAFAPGQYGQPEEDWAGVIRSTIGDPE